MKTRIARVTVVEKTRKHWFFEVPWHVSQEDVKAYVAEIGFLEDMPPARQQVLDDESDKSVTFVGKPVDDDNAIALDSAYDGWPYPFDLQVGQCVWWDDPDDGACSGWFIVTFIDPHSDTVHGHPLGDTDGHTEMLRWELSLVQPRATDAE